MRPSGPACVRRALFLTSLFQPVSEKGVWGQKHWLSQRLSNLKRVIMGLSVQNGIFPDFPQGYEPAPKPRPDARPPQARGRLVPTQARPASETGTSNRRLLSGRGGYLPTIKDPIRPGDQSKDQKPPQRAFLPTTDPSPAALRPAGSRPSAPIQHKHRQQNPQRVAAPVAADHLDHRIAPFGGCSTLAKPRHHAGALRRSQSSPP